MITPESCVRNAEVRGSIPLISTRIEKRGSALATLFVCPDVFRNFDHV